MEMKYPTPCERVPRENSPKMRGFLIGEQPRLSSPTYYPCPSAVSTACFEGLFLSSYKPLRLYALHKNPLTLSLPNVAKGKFLPNLQISFCKILKNKQQNVTVQAESFHLNGHIRGFRPQTQKLASCYKTPPSNLAVKGLRRSERVHATRLTGLSDH